MRRAVSRAGLGLCLLPFGILFPHLAHGASQPNQLADFLSICGDTRGNSMDAVAAAERRGWISPDKTNISADQLPKPDTDIPGAQFFTRVRLGDPLELLAAMDLPGGKDSPSECVVTETLDANSPSIAPIIDELGQWTHAKPTPAQQPRTYAFSFIRGPGGSRRGVDQPLGATLGDRDVIVVSDYLQGPANGRRAMVYIKYQSATDGQTKDR